MNRVDFVSKCFVIMGMVNNNVVRILIDTGADINLIGRNCVHIQQIKTREKMVFQGVGGQETWTFGRAALEIRLNGKVFEDHFEVVDSVVLGEHDVFVGIGFICKYKLILDFANKRVYNNDFSIELQVIGLKLCLE